MKPHPSLCMAIRKISMNIYTKRFSSCESYQFIPVVLKKYSENPQYNVPKSIDAKLGSDLHLKQHHPLNIVKKRIEYFCNSYALKNNQSKFEIFDNMSPVVSTKSCFDDLRIPEDHVSRRPSDTYYLSQDMVLRTHTSAHQTFFISQGHQSFLCSGDVYRRDEIDCSHYPVFHQMEGVRIFANDSFPSAFTVEDRKKVIEDDLKKILTELAKHLFGDCEIRWKSDFFPFTHPSFELEVFFQEQWLEVLGCGVIHNDVMSNSGKPTDLGWAFGLGLERLAMVLFGIPDIRLFWSSDQRFTSQFESIGEDFLSNKSKKFKFTPYSKFPLCYKDVSFWLPPPPGGLCDNDVYEVIRNIAGDLVEKVELFDKFVHPKTGKESRAYRIIYRHMDRSLTNEEVDSIQLNVRDELVEKLKVSLR